MSEPMYPPLNVMRHPEAKLRISVESIHRWARERRAIEAERDRYREALGAIVCRDPDQPLRIAAEIAREALDG